ncbi:MAG TPA: hypothetical protein DIW54_12250 [Chitinophagaceae bacterium]|jgi:hypothetical protein|nr:hypothetical protein [Chitinophagaceae bacterium]
MQIQLIDGVFSRQDATALLAEMTAVKIRFHEGKISHSANAEDIKMREQKIRQLQNQLADIRKAMTGEGSIVIHADALIDG